MDQTVSKEETEAADRWHLWCRLCAKDDPQGNLNCSRQENQRIRNSNLTLLEAVQLYFSVNIAGDEMLPKMLCVECRTLITGLVTFHESVANAQQMFGALKLTKKDYHFNVHTIRHKYRLLDKPSMPKIYYCDPKQNINKIDSRAVPVEYQSDHLEQANFYSISTDHGDDVPINGSIGLKRDHDCSDDELPSKSGSGYNAEKDSHLSPIDVPKSPHKNPNSSDSDGIKKFATEGGYYNQYTITLKYGLLNKPSMQKIDYCDPKQYINEIDSRAVPVEYQSDHLKQANFDSISTEHGNDVPINGSIDLERDHDCSDDESGYNGEENSHLSPIDVPKSPHKKPSSIDSDGIEKFTKEADHFDLRPPRHKYRLLDKQSMSKINYCDPKQNINKIDSRAVPVERSEPLEQANLNIKTEHGDDVPINVSIGLERVQVCSDDVELIAIGNNKIRLLVEISSERKRDSPSFPKRARKNPPSNDGEGHKRVAPNTLLPSFLTSSSSQLEDQVDVTPTPPPGPPVSNKYRFFCEYCSKGFMHKSKLTTHIRVHTKEKPFACLRCGVRYTQAGHLTNHVKTCGAMDLMVVSTEN